MCMYGAFTYDYVSRFLFIEYHMTYHMWWKEGSFILYSWEIELCTPCTRPPLLLSDACTETCIERCASGWVGYKNKCYKLSDTSESWSVGEKSCRCLIFKISLCRFRDQGGHLASVGSSDVHDFLFNWLKEVWFQNAIFSSEADFNTHWIFLEMYWNIHFSD